jgi:hypothetical protein
MRFGRNKAICGKKVTRRSTINKGNKKGNVAETRSSNRMLAISEIVYKTIPTGGVFKPSIKAKTITNPKCIGSMPRLVVIGARTGTNMIRAAAVSIKQPIMIKKPSNISKIKFGLEVIVKSVLATVCGTCSLHSNHP